ncbi:MAG: monovalent cation/H+ antiporter subunit D family protein [Candidatus Omnitrophica bacterium]|nr:monovalent cation/H+ antiporter subunit D family protein [Candidatus Omnitrophota bacterium]
MNQTTSAIPILAVAVSLAAVPLIVASSRRPNLREFWTLAAAVIKFGLVFSLLGPVLSGETPIARLGSLAPGLPLYLRVDAFGLFFALVASALWILTSVYSIGYIRGLDSPKQTRYFASFAVCLGSTIGLAFSGNLITFLIFYEMLSIATYPLVIHKENQESLAAGRKYLTYALSAGLLLILATAWTSQLAPTLEFKAGGFLVPAMTGKGELRILFSLFILGVGVKAAIMPLHSWLPTAMAAPTPVSALLHAVAVVKAGVFGVVRVVFFIFGPNTLSSIGVADILAWSGAITFVLASFVALRQDHLKRRLAYSTIGHLSYIVMGAAVLTPAALTGATLHLAFHAVMKITLFFCAGAIYVKAHLENISDMDGLGRQMPFTFGAFTVGALGLAGVPPVCGFVSKWYLGKGTVDAGDFWFLGFLLLSGLLNAAYFFPVFLRGFFGAPAKEIRVNEASAPMVVPLTITAAAALVLGIAPNAVFHFVDLAQLVVKSAF